MQEPSRQPQDPMPRPPVPLHQVLPQLMQTVGQVLPQLMQTVGQPLAPWRVKAPDSQTTGAAEIADSRRDGEQVHLRK